MASKAAATPITQAPVRVTMYQLADRYNAIRDLLHSPEVEAQLVASGGELPPELAAQFDQVEGAVDVKAEATALFILEQERVARIAKDERDRYALTARVAENFAKGLKGYLCRELQRMGLRSAGGDKAKAKVTANGGELPVRVPEYVARTGWNPGLENTYPDLFTVLPRIQPPIAINLDAVRAAHAAELERMVESWPEVDGWAELTPEQQAERLDRCWDDAQRVLPPGVTVERRGFHVRIS